MWTNHLNSTRTSHSSKNLNAVDERVISLEIERGEKPASNSSDRCAGKKVRVVVTIFGDCDPLVFVT